MGHNRAGDNRKKRLKRQKKFIKREEEKCQSTLSFLGFFIEKMHDWKVGMSCICPKENNEI